MILVGFVVYLISNKNKCLIVPALQSQMQRSQGHVVGEKKKIQPYLLSDLDYLRNGFRSIRICGMYVGDTHVFMPGQFFT